jgi:hypothetical protein
MLPAFPLNDVTSYAVERGDAGHEQQRSSQSI